MQLLRVGVFLLCLAEPRAIICHGISFIITVAGKHCTVGPCITQNFKWKLVYVFGGHGLCSGILFTVF
jgi:hypothetical protein